MRFFKYITFSLLVAQSNFALASTGVPITDPTPVGSNISTECQSFDTKLVVKAAQSAGIALIASNCPECTGIKVSVKVKVDSASVGTQSLPLTSILPENSLEFVTGTSAATTSAASGTPSPTKTPTPVPTPDPNGDKILKFTDALVLSLPNTTCTVSADTRVTARFKVGKKSFKRQWAGKIKLNGIAKLAKGVH